MHECMCFGSALFHNVRCSEKESLVYIASACVSFSILYIVSENAVSFREIPMVDTEESFFCLVAPQKCSFEGRKKF